MVQDDQEIRRKIVKLLDELIQGGKWEGSLFLETWGKKFREMRDNLNSELGVKLTTDQITAATPDTSEKTDLIEVYISLYQADGLSIKKWEAVLGTLGGYNISRPIYKNDSDVRDAIRTKEFKQNDGYAVIKVSPKDIVLPVANMSGSVDRLGHDLVTLKEGAIQQKNIIRFVHQTGIYAYVSGSLIRQSSENPL